jgi:AraC-like DNA-binding protein
MLEQTNEPITRICFDVGFNDSTHFSRTFKKTLGVSARAYRNMKQQGKKEV